VELAKSRSPAGLGAPAVGLPSKESAGAIVRRIEEVRERLNWCYRKITVEEFQPNSSYNLNPLGLIQTIRAHERELLDLLKQLPLDDPCSPLLPEQPVSWKGIQAALPGNAHLLEYYVAGSTIVAGLVDGNGVRFWNRLADSSQVKRELQLLRFQMGKAAYDRDVYGPSSPQMLAEVNDHLQALFRQLLEPLVAGLSGTHLFVVPHGLLHYVPFHALHDGGRYLCERYTVSYAPSATTLHRCMLRRRQPGDHSLVLWVGSDDATPHTAAEVREVSRVLPNARVFSGPAATAERLAEAGEKARFVHIASHAVFRRDNPMFSSIQLGNSWMTLLDVYKLHLNCELAVLSGCGTGMSLVMAGDELVGLARGFLHAGAASLLVSLWDIDDEAASFLMRRFYAQLPTGMTRAESLQKAMADTRQRYPHPFYWAPFILVGACG
jgi:hypothetical protein